MAPNRQIETTVNQIVTVMTPKSAVLPFRMHPQNGSDLIFINSSLSQVCNTFAPIALVDSAFYVSDYAGVAKLQLETLKFFNSKIAHMLLGLGIIPHWTRQFE
jgi:hypothetical protein